jgi:transcription-repair coupling factor (superfamily II helicase)
MEDLEIRGAGNLLGQEQHGFIVAVGFDLYCRLLKEAVVNFKKVGVFNETNN